MWRLPENPIGLILAGFGLTFTLGVIGESLAAIDHSLTSWGVWFGTWQWALSMGLILVLLPLRFPDGRLPSSRYRWVTPVMVVGLAMLIFGNAFKESALVTVGQTEVEVPLPLGLPLASDVFDTVSLLGLALMLAAIGGAVVSAVMRFRRSSGIERQQMKVFAGALSISIVGMTLNLILYELGNEPAANALFAIWVLVLVASIALAVLRYRLYDFDRVISRTVSYALLVLILGAVYVAGAVWLPTRIVGEQSPLFVAGSTLAVAALFTPARRRVMTWVDRRFYRVDTNWTRAQCPCRQHCLAVRGRSRTHPVLVSPSRALIHTRCRASDVGAEHAGSSARSRRLLHAPPNRANEPGPLGLAGNTPSSDRNETVTKGSTAPGNTPAPNSVASYRAQAVNVIADRICPHYCLESRRSTTTRRGSNRPQGRSGFRPPDR